VSGPIWSHLTATPPTPPTRSGTSSTRPEPSAVLRSAAAEFAALAWDLGADVDTATAAVRVAYATDRSAAPRSHTP